MRYASPLLIPRCPPGFAEDVWAAAIAMIKRSGPQAPVVAELRASDDLMDAAGRAYFDEVAKACDYILVLNQRR